jgi:hypothetical protein
VNAADYAREARRMRREGLTDTQEYRDLLNVWAEEERAAEIDLKFAGCLSCFSLKCKGCEHCHECEDAESLSECPAVKVVL